jgi:hypothetical protein
MEGGGDNIQHWKILVALAPPAIRPEQLRVLDQGFGQTVIDTEIVAPTPVEPGRDAADDIRNYKDQDQIIMVPLESDLHILIMVMGIYKLNPNSHDIHCPQRLEDLITFCSQG